MTRHDDRYRVSQTSDAISEALWRVAMEYGTTVFIAVDEQVAIVRRLRAVLAGRSGPLKRSDIHEAFKHFEVRTPPRGFARDMIARLERLDGSR